MMNTKPSKKMIAGIIVITLAIVLIASAIVFFNLPKFGSLPHGERLERVRQSPHYRDGKFQNMHSTELRTLDGGFLRTMWELLVPAKAGIVPAEPVPAIKTDLKNMPLSGNRMVWFGHSSYLLQIDGKRILVDPVFCQASPVSFFNRPFRGADIYRPDDMPDIDYLVITHDHWDHLDYRTVTALKDRVGTVICPLGVGAHFERWHFEPQRLVELDWQEKAVLDADSAFAVHCLPARHFSGRGLRANQSLWASFMLQTPSQTIYIGGDSGYDTHYAEIGAAYPAIDLAILENGQYNQNWRYIHMLPELLGRAADELGARRIITVHHSKYALSTHPWNEPLQNELRAAEAYSLNLIVAQIGEEIGLD